MDYLFLLFLFMIDFLYASVRYGGGSGYLALMVIYPFTQKHIRSSALIFAVFYSIIVFKRGLAVSFSGSAKLHAQKFKYIQALVLVFDSYKLFIY